MSHGSLGVFGPLIAHILCTSPVITLKLVVVQPTLIAGPAKDDGVKVGNGRCFLKELVVQFARAVLFLKKKPK